MHIPVISIPEAESHGHGGGVPQGDQMGIPARTAFETVSKLMESQKADTWRFALNDSNDLSVADR
jgi:hypothetical protein